MVFEYFNPNLPRNFQNSVVTVKIGDKFIKATTITWQYLFLYYNPGFKVETEDHTETHSWLTKMSVNEVNLSPCLR